MFDKILQDKCSGFGVDVASFFVDATFFVFEVVFSLNRS